MVNEVKLLNADGCDGSVKKKIKADNQDIWLDLNKKATILPEYRCFSFLNLLFLFLNHRHLFCFNTVAIALQEYYWRLIIVEKMRMNLTILNTLTF